MYPTRSSPESILKNGLKELSLVHSGEQIRAFMTYLSELKKWNKAYNLTSLNTDEDIVVKHFLDSLLYLKAMPPGEMCLMDVGSGAGFPGIPIKIIRPEIAMYLVEPSRKKAGFLRHIISILGLQGVEVVEKRVEEVKSLAVDVAVTRALFSLADFCGKATPLVKEGGRLIVSKGPKMKEELKAIKGLDYEVLTVFLPHSTITRFLVVVMRGEQGAKTPRNPHPITPHGIRLQNTVACVNTECRLRKAGCTGFEGCPGFKGRG
jgi:16S rRNA (guanine527-N7)-methyltransferase